MPRQAINPYSNMKEISKKDIMNKRYIKQTNRFLGEASRNASLQTAPQTANQGQSGGDDML
jgi:hypothetical protein